MDNVDRPRLLYTPCFRRVTYTVKYPENCLFGRGGEFGTLYAVYPSCPFVVATGTRFRRSGTSALPRKTKNLKTVYTMNIQPLADRVLIQPAEAEQKTASGIIIPDTAKEKPQRGTVLAVGKGTKDHEMTLKVGDNVLYGKYSGTEVEIDGVKYMIMKESDVYAII